ncbi:EAL domain-containing protein [Sphingomonas sp.]|uniref:putative bifunctional diguanylate cyclase/phosphodiesterase n=1 Tax=Sphingomonas sp. TaxID=28214 RepID=UPI0025F0B813|nr:EAL domain-containing protein [Sphingomonas sp.]
MPRDNAPPSSNQSLLAALGLVPGRDPLNALDFAPAVRQTVTAWPMALITHACIAAMTMFGGTEPLGANLPVLLSVALVVTSVAALVAQRLPRLTPILQIRLAMVYAPALGGLLTLLLWTGGQHSLAPYRIACTIAGLGALGGTAIALSALRAPLLMAAGAVVLALALLGVRGIPLAIGTAYLMCLVISTIRLARLDLRRSQEERREMRSGRLALSLVREFESQGTGWFWQTDRDGNLVYLSEKVAGAVAGSGESPLGKPLNAVFQMDSASPGTERTLSFHLSSRTGFSDYTIRPAIKGMTDRWWSISGRPVVDEHGRFHGFIGSGADLTEKRRAEAEITRLALFDGLTGLANRQRMRASLDQTLNQPPTAPYRPTTLFLLDLDRFKAVNDTLGHQVGDDLLKQVAQRLLRAVGDAGLVGRLGGDEFQVILPGENDITRLSDLGREIIASLSQPYSIGGQSISIGCSIGVAIAPGDGRDSETLVRNADLALYAAKADGRGVHRFYREELLHGAKNRKQLEDDLRHALVKDELHLVYQPVVCTENARLVGFEALVRWEHPERGAISPADFIPVAEECGLIESIGEWVLRTACLEAARWPNEVRVGVNVSPIQFANRQLPAIVANAIAKAGIAPQRLELEITESVFLSDGTQTDAMFKALKGLGVRLSLDDFGTGYSSLGYLKSAPFDKIKIDQSFVRGAAITGNRNAAIVRAIVALAGSLGMETTAEGVETQDEIELIRTLGCSHIQGYVYGTPARAEQVAQLLEEGAGFAKPLGYRMSRPSRTAIMRQAVVNIGGARGEVRLRNISPLGAQLDGLAFNGDARGTELLIEINDGEPLAATVRWAQDGKCGVEFAERFDMERLSVEPARLRKAS